MRITNFVSILEMKTMWSFIILALFGLVSKSGSARCPAKYERFSLEHTYCLSRNPSCGNKRSGVSQQDIQEILRLHNQYRSDVALGKETRAVGGALPKAADMLQMVWDDELAFIAQKWAENCDVKHDCGKCREVPNFNVGQTLAVHYISCPHCKEFEIAEPKWTEVIKGWYDEVLDYKKSGLDIFRGLDGYTVGYFTQVIWSETWRIGCGYTASKTDNQYKHFYVCNYGPSGNVVGLPVYKRGQPCSGCPVNACCDSSCTDGPDYPGLCKMLNPNTAPIYQRNLTNVIFFCDFNPNSDCEYQITGTNKWKTSLLGNYMSIVLNRGESTTIDFKKQIAPASYRFCVTFLFRKGTMKAGENDTSTLKSLYNGEGSFVGINLDHSSTDFTSYSIAPVWNVKTKLSLIFSVPKGAKPHILDLKEIVANDGECALK